MRDWAFERWEVHIIRLDGGDNLGGLCILPARCQRAHTWSLAYPGPGAILEGESPFSCVIPDCNAVQGFTPLAYVDYKLVKLV